MKALTILKTCRGRGQKRAGGLDLDEAINELEEAMKPKTCYGCKHYSKSKFFGDVNSTQYCHENRFGTRDIDFSKFCCNRYEPKVEL